MSKENLFKSKPFLLGCACLLIPFDFVAFNLFLYPMQQVLKVPLFQVTWVLIALLITFLFFSGLFFQAALFKRAKPLLICGLLLYALAALIVLGKASFIRIVITRGIQGIGMAMILPASLELLKLSKPSQSYYGWGALLLLGLFVSPWITGLILKKLALGWLFYILGLFALSVALLNFFFLDLDEGQPHQLDLKGFLLIGSSMVTLVLGLSIGLYWGWGLSSLFFFVAFLLLNFAFFAEEKSAYPLFEMELFKDRSFFTGFGALLYLQFVLWPILFFIPIYLQYYLGIPLLSAGLWLLTFTGAVCVGFVIGVKAYKKGYLRLNLALSIFLITLSLFLLSFAGETGHRSYLLSILALLGAGWGILFLNIYSGGVGLFPKNLVRRGFAFIEIFPFLFGAIGLSVGFNIFLKRFSVVFYDLLGQVDILFPYQINDHFFEILNLPHLHNEAVQESFKRAFLSGFHTLTSIYSWIGFAFLVFIIIFTPSKAKEVLSGKVEEEK